MRGCSVFGCVISVERLKLELDSPLLILHDKNDNLNVVKGKKVG